MKSQETRVEHSIANQCKVEEGRCSVKMFNTLRPEGRLLRAIHRMSEAQKWPKGSTKDNKLLEIMETFQKDLDRILNLDNRDCEALTAYALTKGQELMLIPVFKRMGDGVANMRFDLPATDLSKKDPLFAELHQYNADEKSSNNTLLQLLAFHGKLTILPSLGISSEAVEKMRSIQPTQRTNEKSQPFRVKILGKDKTY